MTRSADGSIAHRRPSIRLTTVPHVASSRRFHLTMRQRFASRTRARTRSRQVETASTSFEPTREAPRRSREFLRNMLHLWHADDLSEVAEIVTGELVANVVLHAVTAFVVDMTWDDPELR